MMEGRVGAGVPGSLDTGRGLGLAKRMSSMKKLLGRVWPPPPPSEKPRRFMLGLLLLTWKVCHTILLYWLCVDNNNNNNNKTFLF